MSFTEKLKLKLFETGEKLKILGTDSLNGNFNKIDNALKSLDETATNTDTEVAKKINKDNIANNLVTTQGGFVLDARQGYALDQKIADIVNVIYPVGSLYWSSNNINPASLFGGTWSQITDKFILAAGSNYKINTTGGESTVALTTAQIPSHSHTVNSHSHTLGSHSHTYAKPNASTGSTTLTLDQIPPHTHNIPDVQIVQTDAITGGHLNLWYNNTSEAQPWTASAGGGKGHTHTMPTTSTNTGTNNGNTGTSSPETSSVGNGQEHNNMPPYIVKYCWERTA